MSDEKMEQAASDLVMERAEAQWIMARLADAMQSKTRELKMFKANLEHIFPQNPTVAEWPNASNLDGLTWDIGNLTILGEKINRKAQNKGFAEKSTQHYSTSEIQMTKDLLKYSSWDEAAIRQRGQELVKELARLFPDLSH